MISRKRRAAGECRQTGAGAAEAQITTGREMGGLPCRPPITLWVRAALVPPCRGPRTRQPYGKFPSVQPTIGRLAHLSPEKRSYPRFSRIHAEAYAPSNRDLGDRAVGEAEDVVLRHRQAQRVGARQA